jgi:hypothetical protein
MKHRQMTEAEALIRELIDGLTSVIVHKTIPDDLRDLLDHVEDWLQRQRRRRYQPFTVINGGKG